MINLSSEALRQEIDKKKAYLDKVEEIFKKSKKPSIVMLIVGAASILTSILFLSSEKSSETVGIVMNVMGVLGIICGIALLAIGGFLFFWITGKQMIARKIIKKIKKEIDVLENKLLSITSKVETVANNVGGVATAISSAPELIAKFKELLDAGAITQEEFDTKKKQILEKYID